MSFWKNLPQTYLLSFRLTPIIGIVIGVWLYAMQTETRTLAAFLMEKQIYLLASLIVIGLHLIVWLIINKASFYDIKRFVVRLILDVLFVNIYMLCTVSALFLYATFVS
ncbi:MAG: hypothetical protein PHX68_03600 [Alphaproteobacteria bacterium]|nr:hypothetical protein [Alphaproteobacteria bacterium]